MFFRSGSADHRQDHSESHSSNTETDQDFEKLMGQRSYSVTTENQAHGVQHRAQEDRLPVPIFFRNHAEKRLPNPPGQILDRDRQGKISAEPAEFLLDGNLENPETGSDCKTDNQDQTSGNQHGIEQKTLVIFFSHESNVLIQEKR